MIYWSYYKPRKGFSNAHVGFFPVYVGIEKLPQRFRDGKWLLVPSLVESEIRNHAPLISWPYNLKPGIHTGSLVKN